MFSSPLVAYSSGLHVSFTNSALISEVCFLRINSYESIFQNCVCACVCVCERERSNKLTLRQEDWGHWDVNKYIQGYIIIDYFGPSESDI